MPEGLTDGPKILGMPRKVAIPVLGVAVIAVVYVVIRSRSQGGAIPRPVPESGGDTGAIGGGGGGGYTGGVVNAPPADPLQEKLDRLYFEEENFKYNVSQRQEQERQANYEIQHEEQRSTLDAFLAILPNQIQTQKSREAANQAGYQADIARAGEEASYSNRAAALQNLVTGYIQAGKIKPECGKNESSYLDPNTGEWRCKPSGKSGAKSAVEAVGGALVDTVRNYGSQIIGSYLTGQVQRSTSRQQGSSQQQSSGGSASQNTSRSTTDASNSVGEQHFNVPSYAY